MPDPEKQSYTKIDDEQPASEVSAPSRGRKLWNGFVRRITGQVFMENMRSDFGKGKKRGPAITGSEKQAYTRIYDEPAQDASSPGLGKRFLKHLFRTVTSQVFRDAVRSDLRKVKSMARSLLIGGDPELAKLCKDRPNLSLMRLLLLKQDLIFSSSRQKNGLCENHQKRWDYVDAPLPNGKRPGFFRRSLRDFAFETLRDKTKSQARKLPETTQDAQTRHPEISPRNPPATNSDMLQPTTAPGRTDAKSDKPAVNFSKSRTPPEYKERPRNGLSR